MGKRGRKTVDLTGQKFNQLTVLGLAVLKEEPGKRKRVYWLVQCECGTRKVMRSQTIKNPRNRSCGCWAPRAARLYYLSKPTDSRRYKEGYQASSTYNAWTRVRARYHLTFTFEEMLNRLGEKPDGHFLMLKDPSLPPGLDNLAYLPKEVQSVRHRRDITGLKIHYLTALYMIPRESHQRKDTWWMCRCDCGNEKAIRAESLLRGTTRSCGCYKRSKLNAKP
jgi:hypothetical protein